MKFGNSIFKTFFLSLCITANISFSYAQTASILPNAKTTFVDQNGKPLTSGTVDFYTPGTTTRKTTWQDSAKTVPNTNPVVLDSAGRALIWGDGSYRQVVKDRNSNLIWDQVTSSIGSGGSSGSTIGDGLSVGTILAWSGFIAPANYAFAYGQAISRTTYPETYQALTITTNGQCTGGSPTIINISDTSQLAVGAKLESICVPSNTSIVSKTSNSVTLNNNATVTISTSLVFFPYGNGDGLTTFNLPDLRGVVLAGRENMGGVIRGILTPTYFSSNVNNVPYSTGALGGSDNHLLTLLETPTGITSNRSQLVSVNTISGQHIAVSNNNWAGTTVTSSGAVGVAFTAGSVGDITSLSGTNNIQVDSNNTGGQAHSIVQPTLTQNYIIKIIPDTNLTASFGVASIGGMTGIINCGTNVNCSGNTISVTTPAGVLDLGGMTGSIACGTGISCSSNTVSLTSTGVTSFNSRTGAVVPAAGDYPISKNGTGVINLIQQYAGLQPEKLGSAVIAVNPGWWASADGNSTFYSNQVLTANLNVSSIDFASNPATGGMVSGGLSVSGATSDGTDVMLYLIHRNSDGKVALVGSNDNTYSGVQTQLNGVSGCSPNLCTVDRRIRFAFVWNWATNGGWSGIPDFQAPMGDQSGQVLLTGAGASTVWTALSAGSSTTFADVNLGSGSPGSPTAIAGKWLSNLNRRATLVAQCNFGTGAGSAYVIPKSGGSSGIPVCASNGTAGQNSYSTIQVQTDSANTIQYKVSGTGNTLTLYLVGWTFSDPS